MRRLFGVVLVALVVLPQLPAFAGAAHSENVRDLGAVNLTTWVHRATFKDDYLFAGMSDSFEVLRVDGDKPLEKVARFPCGSNGEAAISRWRHYIFQPVESRTAASTQPTPPQTQGLCRAPATGGVRVVDVSRPEQPRMVGFLRMACGSHNVTPYPVGRKVLLYNSNSCNTYAEDVVGSTGQGGLANTALSMEVIEFDPRRPSRSKIVGKLYMKEMQGCHDVTIYRPRGIAVCTGLERWALLDVNDPHNPAIVKIVDSGDLGAGSAQFTWDGKYVVMNEIPLRSMVYGESCLGPQRELTNGLHIWDVRDTSDPKHVGQWNYSQQQPMWKPVERDYRCHASNFIVVPTRESDRYVAVTGWGNGGLSIIDFSDPSSIEEIAFWQQPRRTITWLTTWYNGRVYVGENRVPETRLDGQELPDPSPTDYPGSIRVLEVDGLGVAETFRFSEGLVPQWQDPADLGR